MNLFGIEHGQQTTPLFRLARANRQAAETSENVEVADTHDAIQNTITTMGGSFVHAYREESRYVAGLKTGLALQNSFLAQMQTVVSNYRNLVEMSGDPSYAKDAVKAVNSIVDDEVEDTNSEELEEIREEIEEKADEAMATESQKVLENETSPQEALDESLDEDQEASEVEVVEEGLEASAPDAQAETDRTDEAESTVPTVEAAAPTAEPTASTEQAMAPAPAERVVAARNPYEEAVLYSPRAAHSIDITV